MAGNLQEQLPFIGDMRAIESSPDLEPEETEMKTEGAKERIEHDKDNDSGDLVWDEVGVMVNRMNGTFQK